MKEIFLDDRYTAQLCLLPSVTKGEETREKERIRLSKAQETWTQADKDAIKALNERLVKWQTEPDSEEAKATLPTLSLSDVKEEPFWTDTQESEDAATVRQMHNFMREQYQISLGEIKMTLAQTVADWRPLLDNLRIHAKKGNGADTRAILHRLKGQLSSIGLPEQSEQAAMLMECLTDDSVPAQALNGIDELIRDLSRIFRLLEQDVTVVK